MPTPPELGEIEGECVSSNTYLDPCDPPVCSGYETFNPK